jgi:hypothetical protein
MSVGRILPSLSGHATGNGAFTSRTVATSLALALLAIPAAATGEDAEESWFAPITAVVGGVMSVAALFQVVKFLGQTGLTVRTMRTNIENRDSIVNMYQDVKLILQKLTIDGGVPVCSKLFKLETTQLKQLMAGYGNYEEVKYSGTTPIGLPTEEYTIPTAEIMQLSVEAIDAKKLPQGTVINIESNRQKHFAQVIKNVDGKVTFKLLQLKDKYVGLTSEEIKSRIISKPWTRYVLFEHCTNYTDIRLQQYNEQYAPLSIAVSTPPIIMYSVKYANKILPGGARELEQCYLCVRGRDGVLRSYPADFEALGVDTAKSLYRTIKTSKMVVSGSLESYFGVNQADFLPQVSSSGGKYQLATYDLKDERVITVPETSSRATLAKVIKVARNRIIIASEQPDGIFDEADLDLVFASPAAAVARAPSTPTARNFAATAGHTAVTIADSDL